MSVLARIEQAEVSPLTTFSPEDQSFLYDHYVQYGAIREHLMAALNSFELRLERVLYPSTVEYWKDEYRCKTNPKRTGYYDMMYDVAEDITKIKNKLIQLNKHYVSQVTEYLNTTYNLALKFDDYKDQKIEQNQLAEAVQIQTNGLSLNEVGIERLKTNFSKRIKRPIRIKNRIVQLDSFTYVQPGFIEGYKLDYTEREKMIELFQAITFFESSSISDVLEGLRILPGYDHHYDVQFEEYKLTGYRTIQGIKFFKNRRLDLRFASYEQARAFADTFRLLIQ